MDPDTNLANIRKRIEKLREFESEDPLVLAPNAVEEFFDLAMILADDINDLDEWISGGGSLPIPWGEARPKKCPRCQREWLHPNPARNALSRVAKVYICSRCGNDEAMRDMMGEHPWPNHPDPVQ